MVLIELVVEQGPVVLCLDLLSSLPQCHWSLSGSVLLLLFGAESGPPVNECHLQLVDPPLGESLSGRGEGVRV